MEISFLVTLHQSHFPCIALELCSLKGDQNGSGLLRARFCCIAQNLGGRHIKQS